MTHEAEENPYEILRVTLSAEAETLEGAHLAALTMLSEDDFGVEYLIFNRETGSATLAAGKTEDLAVARSGYLAAAGVLVKVGPDVRWTSVPI